jgi:hypothetical protein
MRDGTSGGGGGAGSVVGGGGGGGGGSVVGGGGGSVVGGGGGSVVVVGRTVVVVVVGRTVVVVVGGRTVVGDVVGLGGGTVVVGVGGTAVKVSWTNGLGIEVGSGIGGGTVAGAAVRSVLVGRRRLVSVVSVTSASPSTDVGGPGVSDCTTSASATASMLVAGVSTSATSSVVSLTEADVVGSKVSTGSASSPCSVVAGPVPTLSIEALGCHGINITIALSQTPTVAPMSGHFHRLWSRRYHRHSSFPLSPGIGHLLPVGPSGSYTPARRDRTVAATYRTRHGAGPATSSVRGPLPMTRIGC